MVSLKTDSENIPWNQTTIIDKTTNSKQCQRMWEEMDKFYVTDKKPKYMDAKINTKRLPSATISLDVS